MIAVIGAECRVMALYFAERVPQLHTRQISGASSAIFDEATDSWLLDGKDRARVVIDTRTLHVPSIPHYVGRDEFAGPSTHWSQFDTDIDTTGRRIAVIGDRAAHVVPALTRADVTLFDCPPNRKVRKAKRRWRPRRPTRLPHFVSSSVDRITRAGVRTADGAEHTADTIIYATGSTALPETTVVGAGGLTIQQAWHDGAAAYLGVAVHGFPNYFMVHGPDSPLGGNGQLRYIAECLQAMRRKGSSRIEVRRSAQRQFTERARVTAPRRAFEFRPADAQHDIYDGLATLTVDGADHPVHVRLTGHLDPIDGKYHWQGTVETAAEFASRPVQLAVNAQTTQARITETTPWGSYAITGVDTPPFRLGQPT